MSEPIRTPDDSQHIALAGRTGSGKTTAALSMLAARFTENFPWVIIDHKRDENIKLLPAEKFNPNSVFLPQRGLHLINAGMGKEDREELEGFFERAFKRGKIGLYIDEGHLLGFSEALRTIFVAGRSKKVPIMWTSQRAHWIDSFVWSQSSFYRVFDLQTSSDIKRFNENYPIRWRKPDEFHSWYYDVSKGRVSYLNPSPPFATTLERFDSLIRKEYKAV